jgi:GNAT superfamily N-acetyltransferase
VEPRTLTTADLPDLLALSAGAGWNQTPDDWLRLLELAPETCFGVEAGGRVVSSAALIVYGGGVAWIGMVLTLNEHRGRGYATALMDRCLVEADARGIGCVKLDATAQGEPLYRKLGFADEAPVERWTRPPSAAASRGEFAAGWDEDLDRAAFGADRGPLLRSLGRHESAAAGGGFAFARPGRVAAFFGPCVARDGESAAQLADWFLSRHGGETCFWDLFPGNGAARRLAVERGFQPARKLLRMARGPSPAWRMEEQFALAGFELG